MNVRLTAPDAAAGGPPGAPWARIVLRDRSLLDVLDLAARFLVRHARAYLGLAALTLPAAILATWGIARTSGWAWAWTWSMALSPFVAAPFTALGSRLVFEPSAPIRDALRATLRALPSLLAMRLIEGIVLPVGVLLLFVPTIGLLSLFLFANEVVVLERARAGSGLTRLQRLLSGQSGEAIMAVVTLTTLHVLAVVLGDWVGRSVLEDLLEITPPPSLEAAHGSVLALLGYWLFVPFLATSRLLLYINLRTRVEGWDVQTRFAALAARGEAA